MMTTAAEMLVLLQDLCAIPALSGQEHEKMVCLHQWLRSKGIAPKTAGQNLYVLNARFDAQKPTLLLNSHLDTVPPAAGYTLPPYEPVVADENLYALGSNDAGGSLVALLAAFLHFYAETLPINLVFTATAEEEISGVGGIEFLLNDPAFCADTQWKKHRQQWWGLVGEPTGMQMGTTQKGLLVLDGWARGVSGHAARNEGENALYTALADILTLKEVKFTKISALLGATHLSVTAISTVNQHHNVIPDECRFVVDIRMNELYTHQEILALLQPMVKSSLQPRSLRLKSTHLPAHSPLVKAGEAMGLQAFGSATMSDLALIPFPAFKMGPGRSERSHTANEFIGIAEFETGISTYTQYLKTLMAQPLESFVRQAENHLQNGL